MSRQTGAALLLVLWAGMLLAAILVGVAAASRSHATAALYGSERVRAELAAEAGLAHAVAGLRAPDSRQQWVPDGRPYTFAFDAAKVEVRVVDASGLVDLNAATPALLRGVFAAVGADGARADRLANAIVDGRGGASGAPGPGSQASAGAAPQQGPFRVIDRLAHVPGMDASLYASVAPVVTVYSGRNFPDESYADPPVLAAMRGIDLRQAEALVAGRRARPASRREEGSRVALAAPVAGYGGTLVRVFSTAEMPDGTRDGIDVTLRLALTGTGVRPYKVLAWREQAFGGAANGPGHGNRNPTNP